MTGRAVSQFNKKLERFIVMRLAFWALATFVSLAASLVLIDKFGGMSPPEWIRNAAPVLLFVSGFAVVETVRTWRVLTHFRSGER